VFMSPVGLRPENDYASENQQPLQTTDPFSRQKGRPTSTNPPLSDGNENVVLGLRLGLTPR
jgi:hypothetical protein